MTTRAPASLYTVYNGINLPTKVLSGITGDVAHQQRGGYHISDEDQTSRSNYSITMPRDRDEPPVDTAAALDTGFEDRAQNTLMGERLRYAMANDDPRVDCIREIYYWNPQRGGTCGYDHPSHSPAETGQDHSGHVHISFYRDVVNDLDAVRGVIDVVNGTGRATQGVGGTPTESEEDELSKLSDQITRIENTVNAVKNRVWAALPGSNGRGSYFVVGADGVFRFVTKDDKGALPNGARTTRVLDSGDGHTIVMAIRAVAAGNQEALDKLDALAAAITEADPADQATA